MNFPFPFKALGSGISLIRVNWGSRKTRFECVKKQMTYPVKEESKIAMQICMRSNVGKCCDWCLFSSLTANRRSKLCNTQTGRAKGDQERKLPLTACSGAYHRGSESAKQVLIKCCQQRLYLALWCDSIKTKKPILTEA